MTDRAAMEGARSRTIFGPGVLCRIGWHAWVQSRPLSATDAFPLPGHYDRPTRECLRCGRRQKWLPGYGGSEFGCWVADSNHV